MVKCLSLIGKKDEAKKLMKKLIEKENSTGLWSEEMNPANNDYLGNYPQAFSHTALISAALSLQEKSA
jgi:GH15 family glucan-1,4-alpha-glucosidase